MVFFAMSSFAFAVETSSKTGSLYVYSKIGYLDVYLDGDPVGETPVEADNVKIGSHRLTAKQNGVEVYDLVALVKEGEVTTILISDSNIAKDESKDKVKNKDNGQDDNNTPKTSSSSRNVLSQGFYGKLGYVSTYISSYNAAIIDSYHASSLLYSFGYSLQFSPFAAIMLELGRADFASPDESWTLSPAMLSLKIGYPMSVGFDGIYYYSLGIGLFNTSLSYDGKNLSSVGFVLASGIEVPFGSAGTIFLETGYGMAENSKVEFSTELLTFMLGFKLYV